MGKILVTGGAGYIGSHTIVDLMQHGFEVISVDNFINSDGSAFEGIEKITAKKVINYNIDLTDLERTKTIFRDHPDISGIIHFAALKLVGESVEKPLDYYRNNLNSLLNVLECMKEFKVKNLIFSSSCSVYGNATQLPVTEDTPILPAESAYAHTKQIGEEMCRNFIIAHPGHNIILLRYFNPAGAHTSGFLGETPNTPPANLVPIITETAIGKRNKITVFGDDYDTRDGSCIRDYIHVMDLANAHTKSLQFVENKELSSAEVFNVGIGEGVSVLEAINAFLKATNQSLNYEIGPRRAGDVIAIYANYEKAKTLLGWQPKYNIEDIMKTAWEWEVIRNGNQNVNQN